MGWRNVENSTILAEGNLKVWLGDETRDRVSHDTSRLKSGCDSNCLFTRRIMNTSVHFINEMDRGISVIILWQNKREQPYFDHSVREFSAFDVMLQNVRRRHFFQDKVITINNRSPGHLRVHRDNQRCNLYCRSIYRPLEDVPVGDDSDMNGIDKHMCVQQLGFNIKGKETFIMVTSLTSLWFLFKWVHIFQEVHFRFHTCLTNNPSLSLTYPRSLILDDFFRGRPGIPGS